MQDKHQTLSIACQFLRYSRYKLIDACPTLVQVYSTALAIPSTLLRRSILAVDKGFPSYR